MNAVSREKVSNHSEEVQAANSCYDIIDSKFLFNSDQFKSSFEKIIGCLL